MRTIALLLRAVNVGGTGKLPMAELRALLAAGGFTDVRTHLQSGNAVVGTDLDPASAAARAQELLLAERGATVPVLARTGVQLEAVLAGNPWDDAVATPSRLFATFLDESYGPEVVARLDGLVAGGERFATAGDVAWSFHPDGVADSKLARGLIAPWTRVVGTSRNWNTVTKLSVLVGEGRTR